MSGVGTSFTIRLEAGSSLRILTLIDEYTKQCLVIQVSRSIRATDAIAVLQGAIDQYGVPEHIRSDNGSEFIARAIRTWMSKKQIQTIYITPGAPWEQAYIESFHDKFRDECLNRELFASLAEACVVIESWRREYNQQRPHSALDYLTPDEFGLLNRTATTSCDDQDARLKAEDKRWVPSGPGSNARLAPQSPFSGPARCCDVTDPYRAFSQLAGPGRLWISLDAATYSPLNPNKNTNTKTTRRTLF